MTNAFNWKQYTTEERKGKKDDNNTALKRSVASTRAIERAREGTPTYGTVGIGAKTAAMMSQKPKHFNVHKQ
jgi:hypothetical protein